MNIRHVRWGGSMVIGHYTIRLEYVDVVKPCGCYNRYKRFHFNGPMLNYIGQFWRESDKTLQDTREFSLYLRNVFRELHGQSQLLLVRVG